MKSRKINNLLNIKSRKNKIKNNSTRRENFSNNNNINKTLKNKQEKCEVENKPILKHFNISCTGLGDKLMDLWAAATISILIKHKLYVKMKSCKRDFVDNNLKHNYDINNIKIPNIKFILNDYDKSYELFSKNETLIDDNLHLSCARYMSNNTPYYIHKDKDKYYNSKLKYNVNNYSHTKIIDTFKYIAYNTKLLLKNDDEKLNIYKDYIGIHIRATDKIVKNPSPWDMTIEYFNQLIILSTNYCNTLINDKNYNYVICSDDKKIASKFKNNLLELNNNINIIISDNTPEIDMTILSKTKEIIQVSRYSNFTICASLLGNNKVKFFYDEMNDYDNSFYYRKINELLLPDNECIPNKINIDLTYFKYNKYSQRGSDGIIEKIMKELDIKNGFFIEFGGWDGIYLSNCRFLFEKGWNGCFIEADKNKYLELVENYKNSNVICLNNFVYPVSSEGDTIDSLYKQHMNNIEVDLLSIDIDGRDYEIFEKLSLRPKLIIIEGGFSFHPCLRCKIPYEIAKNNVQQPLYTLFKLAKNKNYVPICFNQDTFLLRKDLYESNTFFQKINNDCISLWSSAYFNIFSEKDRLWLKNMRKHNNVVKHYENKYYLDIEHSLYNVFDIVIPIGPNDKLVFKEQINYTKKNIIGFRNIYLICYDPSIIISDCITINENIFPFNKETVVKYHGKTEKNEWYLQQLLKLYAGKIIPDILDKYLVIDSDTFFLKPTTFVEDNKCLYNYGTEYWKRYFEHMKKLDPELIKMNQNMSGICHHMMFETKYIEKLISKIEKNHNDLFYNIFLKFVTEEALSKGLPGASEYEIYFNYMLKYYPDKIQIRKLNWENTSELKTNANLDYISYHWWMRKEN